MVSTLYKCLWFLLMWFYLIFECIIECYLHFKSVISWSYDLYRGGVIESSKLIGENEKIFLQECKRNLTKIPKHLSIIVGPDNKHVNELLLKRIFIYANKVDVDCISYYDTRLPDKGYINIKDLKPTNDVELKILKENYYQWYYSSSEECNGKAKINGICIKNGRGSNGCVKMNGVITRNNNENRKTEAHYNYCEDLPKQDLKIYQLKSEDGRPLIAKICRDLFKERVSNQHLWNDRQSLGNEITKSLSSHLYEYNDPDLCIVFHNNLCTFGLLPWQTRFTEFYTYSGIREFDAYTFANILYSFSKCEQRWGK